MFLGKKEQGKMMVKANKDLNWSNENVALVKLVTSQLAEIGLTNKENLDGRQ